MSKSANMYARTGCLLLMVIWGCEYTTPMGAKPEGNSLQSQGESDETDPVSPDEPDSATDAQLQRKVERAKQYDDVPDGQLVIHEAEAGDLQDDGWCRATSTRGNFAVDLPGNYLDQMLKQFGEEGYPGGVMHTVITITEDGVEFSVLRTEFFGDRPEEDTVTGIVERLTEKGAEVKVVDVELAGRPARKLIANHPEQTAELAIVQAGQSDYLLGVQHTPSLERDLRADIDRFHQSLTIIEDEQ